MAPAVRFAAGDGLAAVGRAGATAVEAGAGADVLVRSPVHTDVAFELEEVDRSATMGRLGIEDQGAEHFTALAELNVDGKRAANRFGLAAHCREVVEREGAVHLAPPMHQTRNQSP